MKNFPLLVFLSVSFIGHSQYAIENYSNAKIDQLPEIRQIADWVQFHNVDNVYPLLSKTANVDHTYLNIESSYLSKQFSKDKIISSNHTNVSDDRNVVWYERNIYKKTKSKLKARYQIYITIEIINDSYEIVDLWFGKKKKINTDDYNKN